MLKSIGRRQFLVGAGGFSLALPTLQSLLSKQARAATPPKRLVIFFTMHGGVRTSAMYPSDALKTQSMDLYPGHRARWGQLALQKSGGRASLSRVLTGSADVLTDQLASKMNLIQGLDIMYYMGHNEGVPLGNFGNEFELKAGIPPMEASIDQVVAQSSAFYPDLASIRQRSITVTANGIDRLSYRWNVGNDYTSGATKVAPDRDPAALFNKIFVASQPSAPSFDDALVVDRVYQSYKALHGGVSGDARMLSAEDKKLLEAHMDRLLDLQRKVKAAPAPSCGNVSPPSSSAANPVRDGQLWNQVITAAFLCGTSRVAALKFASVFTSGFGGSWHQDIVHQAAGNDGAHEWVVKHNQAFFEGVYLDMLKRLEIPDGSGGTLLDHTLALWTMESGPTTHDNDSTPAVCAGSAGGFFKTGMNVDFRNMSRQKPTGIPYNRWLATILQAMGVPRAEWERPNQKGYGNLKNTAPTNYTAAMINDCSEPLPIVT